MTTGSALQNKPIPRQPAAAPVPGARTQAATSPVRAVQPMIAAPSGAETDEEFQLNLADIPRMPAGLHVDGFAPSLTSRILDLFDRLRGR